MQWFLLQTCAALVFGATLVLASPHGAIAGIGEGYYLPFRVADFMRRDPIEYTPGQLGSPKEKTKAEAEAVRKLIRLPQRPPK